MTILVTGARGNVGHAVVTRLLAAGASVRASARDPESASVPEGVEVVRADLTKAETLPAALKGVSSVFLYAVPQEGGVFVDAAREAGVEHIVLLSSLAVVSGDTETNPIARFHRDVERVIEDSGISWTFVRPGAFATNTLAWAGSIRAEGVVRAPYPEAHVNPIHEYDMAEVAVEALITPGHRGAAYTLTGPESLTQRRQVELIAAAIGRPVRFEELTHEQARREWARTGRPPYVTDAMLSFLAAAEGRPASVLKTTEEVTGRPGRTFAQWALDHRADFE
jgi:uncharacterized protein YbjT (DUF2867 family)